MKPREAVTALAAGAGACLAIHFLLAGGEAADPPPVPTAAVRALAPASAALDAPVPRTVRGEDSPAPPRSAPGGAAPVPADAPPTAAPAPRASALRRAAGDAEEAPPPAPSPDPSLAVAALARARGTADFLRALLDLERTLVLTAPRTAPASPDAPGALPVRRADALLEALSLATDPLARQNLLFQVAVRVPPERAFPRLRALLSGDDPGDAADALAALAFRGDPAAVRDWTAMAATAPPLDARILVDRPSALDALAREGNRDLLRAWRCVEALQGRPYFRDFTWPGADGGAPPEARALVRTLLPGWIRLYDGHPGSDDMAYRVALAARDDGDAVEAARWASRAAALPDQDMTRGAVTLLVALAEFAPLDGGLLTSLPDPREPGLSRGLLAYVRLRRTAAERGFAAAAAEAERFAWTEPDLDVAAAWTARWAEPAPRGLDSGAEPLAGDDPLRRVDGERAEETALRNPARVEWMRWDWPLPWEDAAETPGGSRDREERRTALRLHPREEPVRLPLRRLAFQIRCWETVAELQRRAAAESREDRRADLLYKAAAVLYHERDALAPVYAAWRDYRPGVPEPVRAVALGEAGDPWTPAARGRAADLAAAWVEGTLAPGRAASLFEEIRDRYPSATVAAKAAYSAGLAHQRVSEDRTTGPLDEATREVRADHLRAAVAAFEARARAWPATELGRSADDAALFWRGARPGLWAAR